MARKKKIDGNVLAEGEATGHAHRADVPVYDAGDTREFSGTATITHEEHGTITVPDGKYASGQVLEYDPFADEIRKVRD